MSGLQRLILDMRERGVARFCRRAPELKAASLWEGGVTAEAGAKKGTLFFGKGMNWQRNGRKFGPQLVRRGAEAEGVEK